MGTSSHSRAVQPLGSLPAPGELGLGDRPLTDTRRSPGLLPLNWEPSLWWEPWHLLEAPPRAGACAPGASSRPLAGGLMALSGGFTSEGLGTCPVSGLT